MPNVFLKPALDADDKPMVVPDPGTHLPLKPAGEWKEHTTYWARRIRDKDVVESEPPTEAAATPAPVEADLDADADENSRGELNPRKLRQVTERSCGICDHWIADQKIVDRTGGEVGQFGFCRRHAPVVGRDGSGHWPVVRNDERCGDFVESLAGDLGSGVTCAELIAWFAANFSPPAAQRAIESIEFGVAQMRRPEIKA